MIFFQNWSINSIAESTEACISSNLISGVTEALEKHYVILLHAEEMPYVICVSVKLSS